MAVGTRMPVTPLSVMRRVDLAAAAPLPTPIPWAILDSCRVTAAMCNAPRRFRARNPTARRPSPIAKLAIRRQLPRITAITRRASLWLLFLASEATALRIVEMVLGSDEGASDTLGVNRVLHWASPVPTDICAASQSNTLGLLVAREN